MGSHWTRIDKVQCKRCGQRISRMCGGEQGALQFTFVPFAGGKGTKGDIENMIYPTRLVSLAFPSKSRQVGVAGLKPPSSEADSVGHTSEELHRSSLVKLYLSDGQTLYSKLVVGGDGSKSNVRQIAGIKTTGWNYPRVRLFVQCSISWKVTVHGRGFSLLVQLPYLR